MRKDKCIFAARWVVALAWIAIGTARSIQAQMMQEPLGMSQDRMDTPVGARYDTWRPYRGEWEPSAGERAFPEFGANRTAGPIVAPAQKSAEPTISSDRLRYPLTPKARKMIDRAEAAASKGEHNTAIRVLIETRERYPSSTPYVDSLLGLEYEKSGLFKQAEEELQQAVTLMPHEAVNHSNLAFALCYLGRFEEAETEVRRALEIDKDNPAPQKILRALMERKAAMAAR
jgi:tetratricopeptide (TPR) repeat protein